MTSLPPATSIATTPARYKRLIMSGDHFQVVIDMEGDIDWTSDEQYDWSKFKAEDLGKFNLIINRSAELEDLCGLLPDAVRYKRLVAEAVARALDHDIAAAFSMLESAEKTVREQLQEQRRHRYLLTSVAASLPFVLILLQELNDWFGETPKMGFWVMTASGFGALGALLSVIMGVSEPKCSATAPGYRPVIEGAARILGGAIAGGLLAAAVKTGWLLEPLSKGAAGNPTALVAAFAAGFLERLAPNLVNRFDAKSQPAKEPHAPPVVRAAGAPRNAGGKNMNAPQAPGS